MCETGAFRSGVVYRCRKRGRWAFMRSKRDEGWGGCGGVLLLVEVFRRQVLSRLLPACGKRWSVFMLL